MSSTPPPPPGSGGDIPQPVSPTGVPTPPPPPAAAVPPPPPTGMPAPPMSTPGAPPMFTPSAAAHRQYAGWWRRVLAYFIDTLVFAGFMVPAIITVLAGPTEIEFRSDGFDGPGFYEVPTGGSIAAMLIVGLLGIIGFIVLYARLVGKGASLGHRAAGYRIVDANTNQPIGTARGVGRFFAHLLSRIPFGLGYLWPLWDAENRTFHDMVVGTRAVVE